jgi:hypothetical protein
MHEPPHARRRPGARAGADDGDLWHPAVHLVVADGYNHFEVMETLANPFQFAGRAALGQMKLKSPV